MYVTDKGYANTLTAPVSLPQTRLEPGEALVVASVCLKFGQVARYRLLSLQVVQTLLRSTSATQRLNSGLPGAYVGLFSGAFDVIRKPCGLPLLWIGLDGVGYRFSNPNTYQDHSSPDVYTVMAVNNTDNQAFDVVVTGALRVSAMPGFYSTVDETATSGLAALSEISASSDPLDPNNPYGLVNPGSPNYRPELAERIRTSATGAYIPTETC